MNPRLGHVLTHTTEPSAMATLPSPLSLEDRLQITRILMRHRKEHSQPHSAHQKQLTGLLGRWRAECATREQAEIVASNLHF